MGANLADTPKGSSSPMNSTTVQTTASTESTPINIIPDEDANRPIPNLADNEGLDSSEGDDALDDGTGIGEEDDDDDDDDDDNVGEEGSEGEYSLI